MVMLWMRFMSISTIFSNDVSKPFRMNSGRLGDVSYSPFRSMLLCPRNCTSGKVLGLEPMFTFSLMTNDGSRFFRLCRAFTLPFVRSCSPVKVAADPVNVSLRRWNIPLPTTSTPFNCVTSSIKAMVSWWFLPTFTSLAAIPTNDTTSTEPSEGT